MAASRFGASKFRNAVPHVPPREEWYRGSLPASSSSTASATSTFSSEVKANRTLLVTVTPTGDITWRGVQATEDAAPKGQGKVGTGGSVGDWDLGRVEGGELVIGGADGSVSTMHDNDHKALWDRSPCVCPLQLKISSPCSGFLQPRPRCQRLSAEHRRPPHPSRR